MPILIMIMICVAIWPLSIEIKTAPTEKQECSHVIITGGFGLVTHVDTIICNVN